MGTDCVLSEVRTEVLYTVWANVRLQNGVCHGLGAEPRPVHELWWANWHRDRLFCNSIFPWQCDSAIVPHAASCSEQLVTGRTAKSAISPTNGMLCCKAGSV